MTEFASYFGYAIAIIMTIYTFISRKQLIELKAVVSHSENKLKQVGSSVEAGKKSQEKLQIALEKSQIECRQLEKKAAELKAKFKELELGQSGRLESIEEELRLASSQKEHWKEQFEVISEQLREAIQDKKELEAQSRESKIRADVSEKASKLESQLKKSEAELVELKSKLKTQEKQLNRLKEDIQKVDPMEFKRMKARVYRSQQLFNTMKGLREMAEERNRNWESALRLLATHITGSAEQEAIGPLVGEAIEKIGASLEDSALASDSNLEVSTTGPNEIAAESLV